MDSSSSESESSSNDEFLSHESIKSRETGLPNIYRDTSAIDITPEDDEEIIRIMSRSPQNDIEDEDNVLSRPIPSKEKSQSSMEEIVNELANSTTLDECVICLEGASEGELIKNKLCDCVFVYHAGCYYDWMERSRKNTCLLCKKPVVKSNDFITNVRLMNILNNRYKQNLRNIQEAPLNVVITRDYSRRDTGHTLKDWIYNYDSNEMEHILQFMLFFWLLFLVKIIYNVS